MTKYTPGPWVVAEYAGDVTMIEHHESTGYGFRQTLIARVLPVSEDAEGNAALLAAAPDMLAALEALWVQALQSDVNEARNEWGREALELARAAIAKAKGGDA